MWRLGFFFHEMAFGLLSVFLPLYVMSIGGSLIYIGVMSASALFLAIPFSFFWGYICDKTRRYKRYILLSFLSLTVILYLFTATANIKLLIILYAIMSIFHVAHESPKNVLIAESYPHEEWGKAFAFYEAFTEAGWLIGLLLGFSVSTYGLDARSTLLLCSMLNLAAFASSLLLVTDPPLIFERGLVNIEKTVDFAYRGIAVASKLLDGIPTTERLHRENAYAFCSGLVLFSLATSILFTPLPIFFSRDLAIPAKLVFAIFVLSSCGGVSGYLLAWSKSQQSTAKAHISKIVAFRGILAILLMAAVQIPSYEVVLATVILTLMGFAYALFLVYTLSISMELIPEGKSGLFNALVGVGGACGSFIGPFLAQIMGFTYIFTLTSIIFFSAYVAFKIFT
jgi:MFS family permease